MKEITNNVEGKMKETGGGQNTGKKIQGKKYREKIQGGPGGSCEGILKLYRQDEVVMALCSGWTTCKRV